MSKRGKSGKSAPKTKKASKRVQSNTDSPKKSANDQGWQSHGQSATDRTADQSEEKT